VCVHVNTTAAKDTVREFARVRARVRMRLQVCMWGVRYARAQIVRKRFNGG